MRSENQVPMREIEQSSVTAVALCREVIGEIANRIEDADQWTPGDEEILDADFAVLTRWDNGEPRDIDPQPEDLEGHWRRVAEARIDVLVYDDGYAGWTYVGTRQEIESLLADSDD